MSAVFSGACICSFSCGWIVSVLHASCITEMVYQMRYCQFLLHRKIWKCIPKLILANPCTLAIERQLTDWREQVMTLCKMCGLLYSRTDMCLLIKSNCSELQPSVSTSICVAWHFSYLVFYIKWEPLHRIFMLHMTIFLLSKSSHFNNRKKKNALPISPIPNILCDYKPSYD